VLAELEDARREIAELRELQGPSPEDENSAGGRSDADLATAQVICPCSDPRNVALSGLEPMPWLQRSRNNISMYR